MFCELRTVTQRFIELEDLKCELHREVYNDKGAGFHGLNMEHLF